MPPAVRPLMLQLLARPRSMASGEAARYRVLVVAGDPLVRLGLVQALDGAATVYVAEAAPEATAAAVAAERPDVILWDLGPDPVQPLEITAPEDGPPAVALLPDASLVGAAWAAGARGLCLRHAPPARMEAMLEAVAGGLVVLDPDLAGDVLAAPRAMAPDEELTPREQEVLERLTLPNKLIADRLGISENTVKFHVSSILSKLGVQGRTEAVLQAARLGLLTV